MSKHLRLGLLLILLSPGCIAASIHGWRLWHSDGYSEPTPPAWYDEAAKPKEHGPRNTMEKVKGKD